MSLTDDLLKQFAKASTKKKETPKESTHRGTIVEYNGSKYVQLDGSDLLTPASTTTNASDGDRVTVMIKDHAAVITGNLSSPSATDGEVKQLGTQISEFDIIVAGKVTTEELEAEKARIDELIAEDVLIKGSLVAAEALIDQLTAKDVEITGKLTATEAEIDNLIANKLDASVADITFATIESLNATNADIFNLNAVYGQFEELTTNKFVAIDAVIESLDAEYANIDFANIGEAAIQNLFAKSGIIEDLVMSDGFVTGELVGVSIKGDLIQAGTLVADALVIQGEDGLYYRLNTDGMNISAEEQDLTNSLDGSVIAARSVTADRINVTDLVAFGATIGGFHITDASIYSGAKESVLNTTRGSYLDSDGQFAIGDSNNFIRYYKDEDGSYKLAISAADLIFSASNKSVEQTIEDMNLAGQNLIRNSQNMIFDDYFFENSTNTSVSITHDGEGNVTLEGSGFEVTHDGAGNVIIDGLHAIDNGDGNIGLGE